jgi:CxxC-x17-CxxC domain-containing protein
MESQDQLIACDDCKQTFTFTAGEQSYYQERGFSAPKRCKACRAERKMAHGRGRGEPRQLHDAVCSGCGVQTQVPFEPVTDRPVYCRPCFDAQRAQPPSTD